MPSVTVIGAGGFVGSAFCRLLAKRRDVELRAITRANYATTANASSDVVIDASGNSKKFIAEENPTLDFELSVMHRMRTLRDFPAGLQVHISSVDVYNDLGSIATTTEAIRIDPARSSNYGFHKLLAEQLVQHHAPAWLIVRLAGMVGEGLRKNPVYDILTGSELRVHPDSRYQFMSTDDVAATTWSLVEGGERNDIFNICGRDLLSPREIAKLAKRDLKVAPAVAASAPRIVHVSTDKIDHMRPMPGSEESVSEFVAQWPGVSTS